MIVTEGLIPTALPLWEIESYRIEGWTSERTYWLAIVQSQPRAQWPWRGQVYVSAQAGAAFSKGFATSREAKAAVEAHIRGLA